MAAPELYKYGSGKAGNSQAAGVDVAVISNPGKGRWLVTGTVRHTLIDGCRLAVGDSTGTPTPLFTIPSGANASQDFGPIVVDILNSTDDIVIELDTATGASDTACAVIYAQRTSAI